MAHEKKGRHIPPFLIASIIRSCNLKCRGCYDKAKQNEASECLAPELDATVWSRIFEEAGQLGISFILLAGGEPMLKSDVVRSCKKFPKIIFPLFTNGLLINDEWVSFFSEARNVLPVISLEGDAAVNDERRGSGVYAKVMANLSLLKERRILYGISVTLTSQNHNSVLSESFIQGLIEKGARLFFFVEYVPLDRETENLVLTDLQKQEMPRTMEWLRSKFPAMFLDFPGDEAAFGGCLASGRGFAHINAAGAVESCPFAPYSDMSLADRSLSEALASPMLARIRSLQETLGHTGGCTLFENKAQVEELLK